MVTQVDVSHFEGAWRVPYEFATSLLEHTKNRTWPSRLGIGHKAGKLTLEEIIVTRNPKGNQGQIKRALVLNNNKQEHILIWSYSL